MKRTWPVAVMIAVVLVGSLSANATPIQVTSGSAGAVLWPGDGGGAVHGDHGLSLAWYTIGPVAIDIEHFNGLNLPIRGVSGEIDGVLFDSADTIGWMTFSHRHVPRPSVLSGRPQFETPFTMTGVLFPAFATVPSGVPVPSGGYELVGSGVLHVSPNPAISTTFEYEFMAPDSFRPGRRLSFIATETALIAPEPATWVLFVVAVVMVAVAHRLHRAAVIGHRTTRS